MWESDYALFLDKKLHVAELPSCPMPVCWGGGAHLHESSCYLRLCCISFLAVCLYRVVEEVRDFRYSVHFISGGIDFHLRM